jgi:hypothetical protein
MGWKNVGFEGFLERKRRLRRRYTKLTFGFRGALHPIFLEKMEKSIFSKYPPG